MTERTRMTFAAKTSVDGAPWIAAEPLVENLTCLQGGFLGFDLPPRTTPDQAVAIEKFLNEHIAAVSFTPVADLKLKGGRSR